MGGSNGMTDLRVASINVERQLDAVKNLWRANSQTLGFFPDGAFSYYATLGTILTAVDEAGSVVGYLLYREAKEHVAIVHLCVAHDRQRQGVATTLARHLFELVGESRGISVRCRRDFPANALWPKLGFEAQTEAPGRGAQGKSLVYWWRGPRKETLFAWDAARRRDSSVCAVLDANVLFDLQDEPSLKTIPSKSLTADWLDGMLELFVTREVYNEILRNPDQVVRRKSRQFATRFYCLECEGAAFDSMCGDLRSLFPSQMSDQDWSDLRQLAWAVGGNASYFVTRDDDLIALSVQTEERYGLVILHPTDLIMRLDELRRASEYQPARFAGTTLPMRRMTPGDMDAVTDSLQNAKLGESKAEFQAMLRRFLAQPDTYICSVLLDQTGTPLGLTATRPSPRRDDELQVSMFRVRRGPLASTVARQLARRCVLLTCTSDLRLTHVVDPLVGQDVESALSASGFFGALDGWLKVSFAVAEPSGKVASLIEALGDLESVETEALEEWAALLREQGTDPAFAGEQEHWLWPAKITDAGIPTYIVPIRPYWAQELLDEGLAAQTLFGRKEELAFNSELAYYRSAKGPRMVVPARILWYVSGGRDRGIPGTMQLRACSRLDEVQVGLPKRLFAKYKRLGIYQWKEVYETAHGDIDRAIMVLKFSDTELLPNPVTWDDVQATLKANGVASRLQSPLLVPGCVFLALYSQGTQQAKES